MHRKVFGIPSSELNKASGLGFVTDADGAAINTTETIKRHSNRCGWRQRNWQTRRNSSKFSKPARLGRAFSRGLKAAQQSEGSSVTLSTRIIFSTPIQSLNAGGGVFRLCCRRRRARSGSPHPVPYWPFSTVSLWSTPP